MHTTSFSYLNPSLGGYSQMILSNQLAEETDWIQLVSRGGEEEGRGIVDSKR